MNKLQKRSIALSIVLSIITCGIYSIYWIVVLNNELKHEVGEDEFTSGGLVVLFTLLTCGIYGIYWSYKMGEFVDKLNNNESGNTGILYLILSLIGFNIINYALIQNELNKTIDSKGKVA